MGAQFRMIAETIQCGDIGDVNFVRISDHRGDSLRDMQQIMGVSAPLTMSVSGCSAQYEYADFVAVCEPADMGTERIAFYGQRQRSLPRPTAGPSSPIPTKLAAKGCINIVRGPSVRVLQATLCLWA